MGTYIKGVYHPPNKEGSSRKEIFEQSRVKCYLRRNSYIKAFYLKQNNTIERLFNSYLAKTDSDQDFDLLMNCFDNDKNEKLLRRLIRKQLASGFESDNEGNSFPNNTSPSFSQVRARIKR